MYSTFHAKFYGVLSFSFYNGCELAYLTPQYIPLADSSFGIKLLQSNALQLYVNCAACAWKREHIKSTKKCGLTNFPLGEVSCHTREKNSNW